MKNRMYLVALTFIICISAYANEPKSIKRIPGKNMKIRIIMDTHILTATIYNNPTARDFVSLLPLSIKLDDYANTEKIFYLPKKLSLQDAPAGMEPSKGDITYYAPWGNIAIFYRNFQYAKGLVILGKIDSDISILEKWNKSKEVKIEILKPE